MVVNFFSNYSYSTSLDDCVHRSKVYFQKSLNASKAFEHPPDRGMLTSAWDTSGMFQLTIPVFPK